MRIVYLSLTGNVKNFVGRLGMDSLELNPSNPLAEIDEDYIVIAPTYDDDITKTVSEFIEYKDNLKYLIGFAGSGNRNFDNSYTFNARDLSAKYNKPLIFTFEFSGTDDDILEFKKEVYRIEIARTKE